jgi:hypothetical protein
MMIHRIPLMTLPLRYSRAQFVTDLVKRQRYESSSVLSRD